MKKLVLLTFLLSATSLAAEGQGGFGADALLNSVSPQKGKQAQEAQGLVQKQQMLLTGGVKLDDPFVMQLFTEWSMSKGMPYHINLWVQKILKKDYKGAAHLWSKVRDAVPGSFEVSARVAYVYLLKKVGTDRAFWDEWMEVLSIPSYRKTRIMSSLHQTLYNGFDAWLGKAAIIPSPEQEKLLLGLKDIGSPILFSLKARSLLRTGIVKKEDALRVLENLSAEHPYKPQLAQTVSLGFARVQDIAKAATILKHHLEPSIKSQGKPENLSTYYMQIARLLYQASSLDGAESFYLKVPNGRPEFLTAREEVSWVWLRKGDLSKLRGELKNFRTGLFADQFMPEIYVVSAVSNLKLCFYEKVEKDFVDFLKTNQVWAKKIQKNLDATDPARPSTVDFFSQLAEKSLKLREQELKNLQKLGKESITAALPAVGEQSHWKTAQVRVRKAIDAAKKARRDEYRRQWKNMAWTLREAIRKMKFVKVEMLSQITRMAMEQRMRAEENGGAITAPIQDKLKDTRAAALKPKSGDIAFPFDGVVWSDELFRLRSVVKGKCL